MNRFVRRHGMKRILNPPDTSLDKGVMKRDWLRGKGRRKEKRAEENVEGDGQEERGERVCTFILSRQQEAVREETNPVKEY